MKPKDHNIKKPTKKDMMGEIQKNFDIELSRSLSKGLAMGYNTALQEILKKLSDEEDFDIVEYCNHELELRKDIVSGLDKIYDKRKYNYI